MVAAGVGARLGDGDRLACGDRAEHRDAGDLDEVRLRLADELDGAGDVGVAADVAVALEQAEVVVDDRGGADAAGELDLANGRHVAAIGVVLAQEVEDLLLARRDG